MIPVTNTVPLLRFGRIFAMGVILFSASSTMAADKKESANDAIEQTPARIELQTSTDDFEYQMDDRPDPFEPFLKPKVELDPNEIIDTNEVLTGMQLFEPGQLTVVAILKKGPVRIAMVQDSTGKGYVLNTGMKIGKRGKIIDITPDKVIVEETAFTRAKKEIKSRIDMVLKKEGEK
jgi:Tfp pilus assembly protein PilP